MIAQNPKKEFTLSYPNEKIREAVFKMMKAEPNYYVLIKEDTVLNEIRIHQKGSLLDPGYLVDISINQLPDSQSKMTIEISRNMGAINTPSEVTIANNSLKSISSKISSYLSNNINPSTGKANVPQQGCLLFVVLLGGGVIGILYLCSTLI